MTDPQLHKQTARNKHNAGTHVSLLLWQCCWCWVVGTVVAVCMTDRQLRMQLRTQFDRQHKPNASDVQQMSHHPPGTAIQVKVELALPLCRRMLCMICMPACRSHLLHAKHLGISYGKHWHAPPLVTPCPALPLHCSCCAPLHSRDGESRKIMFAALLQAKGLSRSVTSLRSREKVSLKGPCSYTQPSKLEQPGPPLSHKL
jgi:hypothetical protein